MRGSLVAVLLYALAFLGPMVLTVLLKELPDSWWRYGALACTIAAIAVSALSDPFNQWIKDPKSNPFSSTAFVAVSFGLLAAAIWLFLIVGYPPRDIDIAELANTTKYQEAVIIDMYHNVNSSVEETTFIESEAGRKLGLNRLYEFGDLIRQGIIAKTKLALKKAHGSRPGSGFLDNVFLTQKGKALALDLLYARNHPELNFARPLSE